MKYFITIITFVLFAASSFAAEISEADVKAFLDKWVTAQNNGAYLEYADMYSNKFVGIRRSGKNKRNLDHDAWLKDRKKMFKNKMIVEMEKIEISLANSTASIRLEQSWESDTYKDKGVKVLNMAFEYGKIKIIREELLFSNVVSTKKKMNSTSVLSNGSEDTTSQFTSIENKDCHKADTHLLMHFKGAESALECPAPKGWRLFKVYDRDAERSWLNIANKHGAWSTAEQVRLNDKYFFGYFPNIDNGLNIEWKMTKNNIPTALIFRVAATDPNPDSAKIGSWLTRLYVISLIGNEPKFCGVAKTNEDAIEIATKASNCTEPLLKEF